MTTKRATFAAGVPTQSMGGGGEVSIERLSLRVPGRSGAFGRRVASSVAERVAARLPPGASGNIAALKLSVRPSRMSEEGLTEAIADAVVKALEKRRT
jgi:hypothetical protein